MLRHVRRVLTVAAAVGVAAQVAPAATWLPSVRRTLTPTLLGTGHVSSVALTFDDGPHQDGTVQVLDELDRLRWRATFFVLGAQARRWPEVVRETAGRGHEIALHGDAHRYLIARRPRAVADDLRRAYDTVVDVTGATPAWWRPPYGVLSGPALLTARRLGLRPVLWSAWGRDWRAQATPHSVVADLTAEPLAGATLLLHDSDLTSAAGSWRTALAALPLLAEHIAAARLPVVGLSQHCAGR